MTSHITEQYHSLGLYLRRDTLASLPLIGFLQSETKCHNQYWSSIPYDSTSFRRKPSVVSLLYEYDLDWSN